MEVGEVVEIISSAWRRMACTPAAKCAPSPIASSETLLKNPIVPIQNFKDDSLN